MAVKSAPPTTAPLPFPTVSVILLETEPALTNRTLESLKEQAYMPMEVLQTRGSNTAKAYNDAIERAQGETIMLLHSGDTVAPELLQQCMNALSSTPQLHGAYTDHPPYPSPWTHHEFPTEYKLLHQTPPLPYSTVFRKEVWTTQGGFKTNLEGLELEDFWASCSHLPASTWHHIPGSLVRPHDTPWAQRRRDQVTANLHSLRNQLILNNPHLLELGNVVEAQQSMNRHLHGTPGSVSPTKRPLVSVIIPTYNRPELLKRAILSVLEQSLTDCEIIVTNDGPIDVEEIITPLNHRNNITYLKHPHNKGLPAARNTGIKQSRGKYIAYLDDDDCYFPEHLETLVNHLETTSAQVAYSNAQRVTFERVDDEEVITNCDTPMIPDFSLQHMLVANYIPVLCIVHERDCLNKTGLQDESLTTHEDWEFNIRLALQFGMSHVPQVTCSFTARKDGTNMTSSLCYDFLRTRHYIYDKYSPITSRFPKITSLQQSTLRQLQELPPASSIEMQTIINTWNEGRALAALHMARETLRRSDNPDIQAFTAKMLWDLGHVEQSNSLLGRLYNESTETIQHPVQFADILNHCEKFTETIQFIQTLKSPLSEAERTLLDELQKSAESSLSQHSPGTLSTNPPSPL